MSTQTLAGTQNVDTIALTGGTINGVAIGGTTPAAGAFTTLAATSITQPSGYTGTFIVNGTTPVTISSSVVLVTSLFVFGLNTVGGTVGAIPRLATIATGQATVVGTASDTSTYNWAIIKTA